MSAPSLRPLRVGEVLDVAIKVYLRNAKTLFKAVAVVVVPLQALNAIVLLSTVPDPALITSSGIDQPNVRNLPSGDLLAYGAGRLVVGLLGILALALSTAACFKAVGDAYLGAQPDWRTSLRFAARRVHSVVWVLFLFFVLVVLSLVTIFGPVYLGVAWAVALPALLLEDRRGTKALARSLGLVRGRWWATAGTLLVGFVLASVIGAVLQLVVTSPVLFTDASRSLLLTVVLGALAGTLSGIVVRPFQAAIVAIVYFDLRVRKEGFDLELLAERIGVAPGTSTDQAPLFAPVPAASREQAPYWPPPPGWAPPGPDAPSSTALPVSPPRDE